jgi:hypothetical protein
MTCDPETIAQRRNRYSSLGASAALANSSNNPWEITAMVADYYAKNGGQLSGSGLKPKILAQR